MCLGGTPILYRGTRLYCSVGNFGQSLVLDSVLATRISKLYRTRVLDPFRVVLARDERVGSVPKVGSERTRTRSSETCTERVSTGA